MITNLLLTTAAHVIFIVAPESREPVPHPAAQMWAPGKMADNKVEQFLVVARYM